MPLITTSDHFTNFGMSSIGGSTLGMGYLLSAIDTLLILAAGDGARFPAAPFNITIGPNTGTPEIARVTAKTSDSLTIVRGQENTTARIWNAGTIVQHTVTASNLNTIWTAIQALNGASGGGGSPIGGLGVSVKDHGAFGDGSNDDTAAVQAALDAAHAAGGGSVLFPAGTYLVSRLTIYSLVHLVGEGAAVSTIKLKSGSNTDLIWGGSTNAGYINLAAGYGSSLADGANVLYQFGLRNLTLDGNKAGQGSGPSYPLRVYGYGYLIENVVIKNGYSGGILSDWNGGAAAGNDSMEAFVTNTKVHSNNGIGIQWGGPHDTQFVNVISYLNGSHCFHFGPNCGGTQLTSCHAWGPQAGVSAVCYLIEAGDMMFENCQAEGSDWLQVAFICAECSWIGGRVFSDGTNTYHQSAFMIGQPSGQTPIPGQILQGSGVTTGFYGQKHQIDTVVTRCEGANGAFWFYQDGGFNTIRATLYQLNGSSTTGFRAPTTSIQLNCSGLTPDGSTGKGGGWNIGATSSTVFSVTDAGGTLGFNVNTYGHTIDIVNNFTVNGYSDDYGTYKWGLNTDGAGSWHTKGNLTVDGTINFDNTVIHTDGFGNLTALGLFLSGTTFQVFGSRADPGNAGIYPTLAASSSGNTWDIVGGTSGVRGIKNQASGYAVLWSFDNAGSMTLTGTLHAGVIQGIAGYVGFKDSGGAKIGEFKTGGSLILGAHTIYSNDNVAVATTASNTQMDSFDIAELYPCTEDYAGGTVVCLGDDGLFARCTHDGCDAAMVVSSHPGVQIGFPPEDERPDGAHAWCYLALAGRVPAFCSVPVTPRLPLVADGLGGVRPLLPNESAWCLGYALGMLPNGMAGLVVRPAFISQ